MEKRKLVTMQDVAKLANVSITTVSHVVNQTASISPDTIAKVQRAMVDLGYRPKKLAQLREGKRTIGIFAPEIANEYYASCIQVIFQEAWSHGYAVMVCDTHYQHSKQNSYIKSLIANGICGLIFIGGMCDEEYIIDASRRVPVVLCDRTMDEYPLDCVITNNKDIMRKVVGKLADAGYCKLGYIGQDLGMTNIKERFEGYKLGLTEHGLEYNPEWIHISSNLRLNKAANANSLLHKTLQQGIALPQIFLCSSDLIAIGAISALQQWEYSVPRDVGIIGFDGISISPFIQPPLTTIAQDIQRLGKACFALLSKRIEHSSYQTEKIVVPAKIIFRGTTRM